MKPKRRLGGKGLSLEAFAAAKSTPALAPSQLRKQKLSYQNAKIVKKYKKSLKHMEMKGEHETASTVQRFDDQEGTTADAYSEHFPKEEDSRFLANAGHMDKATTHNRKHNKMKAPWYLKKLLEESERKKVEEEKARTEREEIYEAKRAARARAESSRRERQQKMRKKTSRGQPVMKHRLEQLLSAVQRE